MGGRDGGREGGARAKHGNQLVSISVIFIQIIECSDISDIYVCLLHACSTLTTCRILSLFICSQLAHSHLNRWSIYIYI